MIRILFLGDIIGRPGRKAVAKMMPELQEKYRPDFILTNAENSAEGFGLTPETVREILDADVDAMTSGNHAFDRPEGEEAFLDASLPLLRPANWPGDVPGKGSLILEKNGKRLLFLNVLGRIFMGVHAADPFETVERLLKEHAEDAYDCSVLDFHAEATSEKRAIAEVFDGRIDLIVGTHMHVQTADNRTLQKGTGFLTDLGMCGPSESIIGVDPHLAVKKLRTFLPIHVPVAAGPCEITGCVADIHQDHTQVSLVRMAGINVD